MPTAPARPSSLDLLGQLPLFAGLSERELTELCAACRLDRYEIDGTIFYQGDECDRLWLLNQGRLKMVHHEEDGREVILEIIEAGEIFGGATIFLDQHPATAIALAPSEATSFPRTIYVQFLRQHPEVAMRLIRMLGSRLHSVMDLHIMAGERVERRLAHILLKLAARAGRAQEGGTLITIPLSRQDLADMAGTTLETTIRLMSRFSTQGMVKTLKGGYILLLDEKQLHRMAGPSPSTGG
jgi:CRP-like cAMP-binding protein